MIIFKIQFLYKEKLIEASVHELETPLKQWHVTVTNEGVSSEVHGTYIIQYDEANEKYTWGFPSFDTDHSFMHSMGKSLRDYLLEYGWNSVNV